MLTPLVFYFMLKIKSTFQGPNWTSRGHRVPSCRYMHAYLNCVCSISALIKTLSPRPTALNVQHPNACPGLTAVNSSGPPSSSSPGCCAASVTCRAPRLFRELSRWWREKQTEDGEDEEEEEKPLLPCRRLRRRAEDSIS